MTVLPEHAQPASPATPALAGAHGDPAAAAVALRLTAVRGRIAAAAVAAGRPIPALVAVSKTFSEAHVRAAYAAGQRDFGESYAQELTAKAAALADLPALRWHFIGHLQRNKLKVVAPLVSMVHSVDSARLAEALGRHAGAAAATDPLARGADAGVARARRWPGREGDPRLPVLVEVNVASEPQKSGCAPSALATVLAVVEAQPSLALAGLMTVPPHAEDPAEARRWFEALARLRDAHGGAARLPELSMGMSHDLEQAVAAGATVVRVGTAIFGERA